ncbi:hypothetical protein, partial [Streptomonospora sediminis]
DGPARGGQRNDGGTAADTPAGLPRRSAAHASPLRMMPAADPDIPDRTDERGDRAERIRDDLDGFIEGERAASDEGGHPTDR